MKKAARKPKSPVTKKGQSARRTLPPKAKRVTLPEAEAIEANVESVKEIMQILFAMAGEEGPMKGDIVDVDSYRRLISHLNNTTAADDVAGDVARASTIVAKTLMKFEGRGGILRPEDFELLVSCMGAVWIAACRATRAAELERRSIRAQGRNARKVAKNGTGKRHDAIRNQFAELMKTLNGATECYERLAHDHDMSVRQVVRIVKGTKRAK